MRDADSPAANAPHLIRKLELYHVLLDAGQVLVQIAVVLIEVRRHERMNMAGLIAFTLQSEVTQFQFFTYFCLNATCI